MEAEREDPTKTIEAPPYLIKAGAVRKEKIVKIPKKHEKEFYHRDNSLSHAFFPAPKFPQDSHYLLISGSDQLFLHTSADGSQNRVHVLRMHNLVIMSIAVADHATGWTQAESKALNTPYLWESQESGLSVLPFAPEKVLVQMTDGSVFPFDPAAGDFVLEQVATAGVWRRNFRAKWFGITVRRELFPHCP